MFNWRHPDIATTSERRICEGNYSSHPIKKPAVNKNKSNRSKKFHAKKNFDKRRDNNNNKNMDIPILATQVASANKDLGTSIPLRGIDIPLPQGDQALQCDSSQTPLLVTRTEGATKKPRDPSKSQQRDIAPTRKSMVSPKQIFPIPVHKGYAPLSERDRYFFRTHTQ